MTIDIDREVAGLDSHERRTLIQLCLGRIFRIGSRPPQPGDDATIAQCEAILLACREAESGQAPEPWRPNFARDRLKGAAGD